MDKKMNNNELPKDAPDRIAQQWYFSFLRRELEQRGQGEAAIRLHEMLRLQPLEAKKKSQGNEITMSLSQHLTDYHSRFNALSGENISWYIDFLAIDGDTSMPEDEAFELATATVQPPEDAELAQSGYETISDVVIYRSRWRHTFYNSPVEGDYIEVLINGQIKRPFSYSRIWHTPDLSIEGQE